MNRLLVLLCSVLFLTSCAVGPDYIRPTVTLPAHFSEDYTQKISEKQHEAPLAQWWLLYNDPTLDVLQEKLLAANQTLAQAEANYRQAQALAASSSSTLWPTFDLQMSSQKASSKNIANGAIANRHTIGLQANWEVDLWGKLRRELEASQASAAASAAELAAMRLSLEAQLAQNYFLLRSVTSQINLLKCTIKDYTSSLKITKNRYEQGIAAHSDVDLAFSQLKNSEVQISDMELQKTQLIHSIALLVGENATDFQLPDKYLPTSVPEIPEMLPSNLLERRPDIVAAEMQMKAASAKIGIAKAAWFPDISLSGNIGSQSTQWADLLTLPTRTWAIGPALALTVFDASLRKAQSAKAIAAYDATVANYRQTILSSIQEVEDSLASLRYLYRETQNQNEVLGATHRALLAAENQYKAGLVSYQNVITEQTTVLAAKRNKVNINSRLLEASILLVKSLGGDWSVGDTNDRHQKIALKK